MFCSKCGSQLPDGAVVCPSCGERFEQENIPQGNGGATQQPNGGFQRQMQSPYQVESKAKLGIGCGVLAALLSFSGALGWNVVFALIAGYIFLFESDQWLKNYTAKITKIFVIFNVISLAIILLRNCLSVLIDMDIFSNKLVDGMYKMSNGLSVIDSIVGIVFAIILLLNAIKAYNMRK